MSSFNPNSGREKPDLRLGIGSRHSAEGTADWASAHDTVSRLEKTPLPEVDVADTLRRMADPALKDLVNPSPDVTEHALLFRKGRRSTGNYVTRRSGRPPQHRL